MVKVSSKYWSLCIYVVLALATLAVFRQVYNYDFINYDDFKYVSENSHVKSGLTGAGIVWAFTTGHASNWHPLTWLSHMLDCQLFGTEAGRHHLSNLLLHVVNALLLFAVFKRMTGSVWRSGFVAAAFALHPLHVESVAWISERKDVLSTLFWMLTMAGYLRYVKRGGAGWYSLTLITFALGLMAKPMLITLPFVLLLLDYWPLGRFQNGRRIYHLVWEKIPFFILSVVSSVITFAVQKSGGSIAVVDAIAPGMRVGNALISYVKYITKMVWPSGLAVFYPHPVNTIAFWQITAAVVFLLGVSVLVIFLSRSHRYLPVGWLWYLGTLVPVIGLVQAGEQAMADRYSYVPLIGLFIITGWGAGELLGKWRYRTIALGVSAVAVLSALAVCSRLQVRHWRSSKAVFEHTLNVTDNNYLAHCLLANSLREQGEIDRAIAHNYKALQIRDDYLYAHIGLGLALVEADKLDEAIQHYTEALRIKPEATIARTSLGKALLQQGKLGEAARHYRQVLQAEPFNPDACNGLGIVLVRQGNLDEAIVHFTKALSVEADFAESHGNLGYALALQGSYDRAVVHLTRAVELDPNSASAHYNLARILTDQGRTDESIAHFNNSLRLEPDWVGPINALAWILATHKETRFRDYEEAVRLAERACELTDYKEPNLLDTLAAAYASAGKLSEAVVIAEKALRLARSSAQNKLTEKIKGRLRLYRAGQPYIERSPKIFSE